MKTAEYPLVDPLRNWPKMKNREAVSIGMTDGEDAEFERSPWAPASGSSRLTDLCGVARRSVDGSEQQLLEPVGVQQDALVAVLCRVGADVGNNEGREGVANGTFGKSITADRLWPRLLAGSRGIGNAPSEPR